MRRMIFEDKKTSGISQLLLVNYTEEQLQFADGNGNIISKLKDVDKNDLVIVFFDLSPEIQTLVQTYNKLLSYIGDKEYRKVFVIPIPCIEYFILKEFAYDYLTKNEQEILDFKVYYKTLGEQYKVFKSFEKLCKGILDMCSMNCLAVSEEYSLLANIFYYNDCPCGYQGKYCMHSVSVSMKCKRLHDSLPVQFAAFEELTEMEQYEFAEKIRRKYVNLYNEWVAQNYRAGNLKLENSITLERCIVYG